MRLQPELVVLAALAFLCSTLAVGWLARKLRERGLLDEPNQRSSHVRPTPRGGGVGLIFGFSAALAVGVFLLGLPGPSWAVLAGAAALAAVGAADDWRGGVKPVYRLALQIAAALLVVWSAGPLDMFPLPRPLNFELGWVGYPLSLLWIIGVSNIYNFIDGVDGIAGSQGALAGIALAIYPIEGCFAVVGWCLAGACMGFLCHNWHPAGIFMGDSGSVSIGFLLAAMPFSTSGADRSGALFLVALTLWFFLSDGFYTLLRRAVQGERFWEPHRTHLYQRLTATGLAHDQVVVRVGLAAAALVFAANAGFRVYGPESGWPLLLLAFCGFAIYLAWTRKREAAVHSPSPGRISGLNAPGPRG